MKTPFADAIGMWRGGWRWAGERSPRREWWLAMCVVVTLGLGTYGFLGVREDGSRLGLEEAFFRAVGLLALQTLKLEALAGNPILRVARWTGLIVWFTTIGALLWRAFRDRITRAWVARFRRGHVIVAGLGRDGIALVRQLVEIGRKVVVIEPDRDHPDIGECRRLGVNLIHGSPSERSELEAAQLDRAATLLALFAENDDDDVRTFTTAYEILSKSSEKSKKGEVSCVVRVTDARPLKALRVHALTENETDRFRPGFLNAEAVASAAMVRESRFLVESPKSGRKLRKVLVLSLGKQHRLGEMVVVRLLKDRLIEGIGRELDKLEIEVHDRDALLWYRSFQTSYPNLEAGATIVCKSERWPRKLGPSEFGRDFDAAFVCVPDESSAAGQAVMLGKHFAEANDGLVRPILVRVRDARRGFGKLIEIDRGEKWGSHLIPIGVEEALSIPGYALEPHTEVVAQTIHHYYRRVENPSKAANQPWSQLPEHLREDNRRLAARIEQHLAATHRIKKPNAHVAVYRPELFLGQGNPFGTLHSFSPDEIDYLAEREHEDWCERKRAAGFEYRVKAVAGEFQNDRPTGDARKFHHLLVAWDALPEEEKKKNRAIVESFPRILAAADYVIERKRGAGEA